MAVKRAARAAKKEKWAPPYEIQVPLLPMELAPKDGKMVYLVKKGASLAQLRYWDQKQKMWCWHDWNGLPDEAFLGFYPRISFCALPTASTAVYLPEWFYLWEQFP